jgi:hypothetical protein
MPFDGRDTSLRDRDTSLSARERPDFAFPCRSSRARPRVGGLGERPRSPPIVD